MARLSKKRIMMMIPKCELHEPESIAEACRLLSISGGGASLIAGGTELLVNIKKGLIRPVSLISLASAKELNNLSFDEKNGLSIGSMVTVAELAASDVTKQKYPALSVAANKLGSLQIRNRATIGGNICSARPAADLIGPLIAYGATVTISNGKRVRIELLEDIFTGPGEILIFYDEILAGIHLEIPAPGTGTSYIKFGSRKAMEIPVVSVTSVLTLKDHVCLSARIVLGAVAPTFIRSPMAEDLLTGKIISEELAQQVGQLTAEFCNPISDTKASADYRRHLVQVLISRSVMEAVSAVDGH
jgi:CO/xanthine dehydrogenase FAD-binding subunit